MLSNFAIADTINLVDSGDVIESSVFNKIGKMLNKILDIKIPTGENVYSANISGSTVYNQSTPWLQSCGNNATGRYQCYPLASLNLTQQMNCSVTLNQNSLSAVTALINTNISSTSVIAIQGQQTSTNAYYPIQSFILSCQRAGADYYPYKTIKELLISAGLTFLQ